MKCATIEYRFSGKTYLVRDESTNWDTVIRVSVTECILASLRGNASKHASGQKSAMVLLVGKVELEQVEVLLKAVA